VKIRGPFTLPGVLVIGAVAAAGWWAMPGLSRIVVERPASVPSVIVGALVAVTILSLTLWIEHDALRHAWRARSADWLRLDGLGPPTLADRWKTLPDPLEALTRPLLRLGPIQRLTRDWIEAGLGSKGSRAVALLAVAALGGWLVGVRMAGPLFGGALALALPLAPRAWIASRAETVRRRFGEQMPAVLDALASGLAAGLSFQQAVTYAAEELPPPAGDALRTLSRRMALGFQVEQALNSLLDMYPEESLGLVVDGINLQRQFGGDLVRMLSETGARLRERIELEQEVRAVTAQGRLSGWVLAALVPVSASLLLVSNPRYIDVLFDTWIGQLLLVISLALQLAGWAVISRMVRIAY
jgi:tight adherence protein B